MRAADLDSLVDFGMVGEIKGKSVRSRFRFHSVYCSPGGRSPSTVLRAQGFSAFDPAHCALQGFPMPSGERFHKI